MRKLPTTILLLFCSLHFVFSQNPNRVISDADLTNNGDFFWSKDTTYILDGLVFLEEGGQLTIEAGTVIKARQNPTNDPITALIISQNAQILAEGDFINPIIFTSEWDDLNRKDDLTQTHRGLWGGIILLGNAPVITDTIVASQPLDLLNTNAAKANFGGSNMEDNSGKLQYVSIRYAGGSTTRGNFAGLTLAGVGSATTINYIEVFAALGDGFQCLGGTAEMRYLTAAFCGDDAYDWNLGYRGKGQYWFGIQGMDVADNGLEAKGIASNPTIYNMTLIGSGINSTANNPTALYFSQGSGGTIAQSIFVDFPKHAIEIEDLPTGLDSRQQLENGQLNIVGNTWGNFGSGTAFVVGTNGIIRPTINAEDPTAQFLINHLNQNDNLIQNNPLVQINRQPEKRLNPITQFLIDNIEAYPDDDFFIPLLGSLCFGRGAFIQDGAWWLKYWSAMDDCHYLEHPCVSRLLSSIDFELLGQDTILVDCHQIEALDIYYECNGPKCNFFISDLGVAMRKRRKKRKKKRFQLEDEYCYVEEWVWEGYDVVLAQDSITLELDTLHIDTFEATKIALIIDTIPPEIQLVSCENCVPPLDVKVTDCDTAWLVGLQSDTLNQNPLQVNHTWTVTDYCNNLATVSLQEQGGLPLLNWYYDKDQDGYGTESILWMNQPDNFAPLSGDCDDSNPMINPGMLEDEQNAYDDNCDGIGNMDKCVDAPTIMLLDTCQNITFSTVGAVLEQGLPNNTCFLYSPAFSNDVWFKVAVPSSGNVIIAVNPFPESAFQEAEIHVYSGNCQTLSVIECGITQTENHLSMVEINEQIPNDTLLVQITGRRETAGSFSLCVYDAGISVGTENLLKEANFTVFPNPLGSETLQIKANLPNDAPFAKLEIRNILGQLVHKEIYKNPPTYFYKTLSNNGLKNGVYMVTLDIGNGQLFSKKVIKRG